MIKGGKAFASGGFGCVFSPALKCENKKREPTKITKLLTTKNAKEEYEDIVRFKPQLSSIPNYKLYFIIDNIELCKPDPLTEKDLENYDHKCNVLIKDGIYKNNINQSLDKVLAINMPFGGISIDYFIKKNHDHLHLLHLNNSLISLLENAILPMNKLHIYHCDIKENNILIDEKLHSRLIDWGLSFSYNSEAEIPKNAKRTFQYNLPFTNVLFNEYFIVSYNEFLAKDPKPTEEKIKTFVLNYIFFLIKLKGKGHISTINDIFYILYFIDVIDKKSEDVENSIENEFSYHFISDYITKVVFHYTRDGIFHFLDYFSEVFLKIVDIYGLILCYLPLYEYFIIRYKYKKLSSHETKILHTLKKIFMHYLFQPRITEYNVPALVKELKVLNEYFMLHHKHHENGKTEKARGNMKQNNKTKKNGLLSQDTIDSAPIGTDILESKLEIIK